MTRVMRIACHVVLEGRTLGEMVTCGMLSVKGSTRCSTPWGGGGGLLHLRKICSVEWKRIKREKGGREWREKRTSSSLIYE